MCLGQEIMNVEVDADEPLWIQIDSLRTKVNEELDSQVLDKIVEQHVDFKEYLDQFAMPLDMVKPSETKTSINLIDNLNDILKSLKSTPRPSLSSVYTNSDTDELSSNLSSPTTKTGENELNLLSPRSRKKRRKKGSVVRIGEAKVSSMLGGAVRSNEELKTLNRMMVQNEDMALQMLEGRATEVLKLYYCVHTYFHILTMNL